MNLAKLKELYAKATPEPWEYKHRKHIGPNIFYKKANGFNNYLFDECCNWGEDTAKLIVAMRNALPELIAELEEARQSLTCCEVQLEREIHMRNKYAEKATQNEARAEKAEAERDWLIKHIADDDCPRSLGLARTTWCDECIADYESGDRECGHSNKKCWIRYAAQEAATN